MIDHSRSVNSCLVSSKIGKSIRQCSEQKYVCIQPQCLNVALNRRFTATHYFLAACAVISNYLQFLFNKALQYKTISKGHCLFDALSLFIQLIASSARLKQACSVLSWRDQSCKDSDDHMPVSRSELINLGPVN